VRQVPPAHHLNAKRPRHSPIESPGPVMFACSISEVRHDRQVRPSIDQRFQLLHVRLHTFHELPLDRAARRASVIVRNRLVAASMRSDMAFSSSVDPVVLIVVRR